MLRSVRNKLLVIFLVILVLEFMLVIFDITRINQLAQTADLIVEERIPLARCSEQALVALISGAGYMDKTLLIRNLEEIDKIKILEGDFTETLITFDMFIEAMMWGSESEAFKKSSGGLTFAEWKRKGWSDTIVVKQAPHPIRQMAGVADIYHAGFSKYAKKVFKGQKKILRLELLGKVDEINKEKAELEENIKKANRYKDLVNEKLEAVVMDVHQYLSKIAEDINYTKNFAIRMTLLFYGIVSGLALVLAMLFAAKIVVRPIVKLHRGTEIIGSGNLDYKVGTSARDEIGQLSRAFDQMSEKLKTSTVSRDELAKDVMERKRTEEQLREAYQKLKATEAQLLQSAKMASVGLLAGGVAHDINNPLTGALNNTQLIKMMIQQNKELKFDDFKELLDTIEESCKRCVKTTRSLLDFSHASKGIFQPICLNELIEKVMVLIEHEMKLADIAFQKELAPDLPNILGDSQLLQQVIFDLVSNAKWAIEQKIPKGHSLIHLKTEYDLQDKQVLIQLSDTGIGMSKENLERIFEPFFTTKPVGEGTGLGLSIVYSIIKEHKGTIQVESELNKGTTFKIRLPAV